MTTTTTTSTPGGYTSRFVAHVAQTTAHDEATSNSSNPLDRDRFRAFSANGTGDGYSPVADKAIASATFADYAFDDDADDGDVVKSQPTYATSSATRTDVITDTDKSTTSSISLHLAISEPSESRLESIRDDTRVASSSVAPSEDEGAFAEDRSGNGEISSSVAADLVDRHGPARATDDDSRTTQHDEIASGNRESDVPGVLRIVVEDVDAEQLVSDLASRSVATSIAELRDRSRSKDSQAISECSSSASGQTASDSESGSDSENGSEEENEEQEEEEDDESRDENCNVKERKEEKKKKDDAESEVNEESESSADSASDEEATILSVNCDNRGENSATLDDRYERESKRRSASIINERSIEEMFDDNGWVITEQDLQQELQTDLQTTILPGFRSTSDSADCPSELTERFPVDTASDLEDAAGTHTEEIIPRNDDQNRGNEISSSLQVSSARPTSIVEESGRSSISTSNERAASENLSRSRVYRQSNLGKNGWLVTDESESESERATSPIEAPSHRDGDTGNRTTHANVTWGTDAIEDSMMGSIDENGWVIINGDGNDVGDDDRVGDRGVQENTIRSQTTGHVTKSGIENGALVANANRSRGTGEQSGPGEHEETPGTNIAIPMQMVTTVFCVSVLCYSVLTSLFP